MNASEYLKQHAISKASEKKFGITYDENYLNIPVYDENGEFLFNKSRNLHYIPKELRTPEQNIQKYTQKYKNESGSHAALFNYHNVKNENAIVICEGEMDCICLNQNGIPAVTSTSGSGTFDKAWIELLKGKLIYICYDNDEAGIKGTKELISMFPEAKVIGLPEETKDVCEFFASANKREDFVNLTRIAQPGVEWRKQFRSEDFNVSSTAQIRAKEFVQEPWLIKDILYSQGFCFVYGSEGTGKSLVAMSIAKAVATGEDWLGKFKTNGIHNVLIMDKENPHSMLKKRLEGLDIACENIYYLDFPEKFKFADQNGYTEFAMAVSDIVREKHIDLIIIDSFVDFIIGNESSSVDTQDFFDSMRELYPRIAYLGIHHENKPSQGVFRNDSQRLRGSSNINAQLFTAFRLEPVAKSKTELTIKQVKARDSQKLDKFMIRMIIGVLENGDTFVKGFEYCGLVEESVDESKLGEVESIIAEMLTSSAYVSRKQVEEIGEGKGMSVSTIRRTLKKMIEAGTINEVKKGKEKWYTKGLMAFEEEDDDEVENPNEIFDGSLPGLD